MWQSPQHLKNGSSLFPTFLTDTLFVAGMFAIKLSGLAKKYLSAPFTAIFQAFIIIFLTLEKSKFTAFV